MSEKLSIRSAILWLENHRGITIKRSYLHTLCWSGRLKSELRGNMRFIGEDDLSAYEFRKPGRPKK